MTLRQEFDSWLFPTYLPTSPVPQVGAKAPSTLQLQLPCGDGQPAIVTFLRHCGCPFAEKTFRSMRSAAKDRPEIHFVAVSHSDQQSTDKWLKAIGGAGDIGIVVDHDRTLYARWGLDISSLWHVLNPWSLWNVYKLGKTDGIWNKPTESGSRWQTTGMFVVDGQGVVRWGGASVTADEIPDYNEAVHSLS